jgi:hypothetical protein
MFNSDISINKKCTMCVGFYDSTRSGVTGLYQHGEMPEKIDERKMNHFVVYVLTEANGLGETGVARLTMDRVAFFCPSPAGVRGQKTGHSTTKHRRGQTGAKTTS